MPECYPFLVSKLDKISKSKYAAHDTISGIKLFSISTLAFTLFFSAPAFAQELVQESETAANANCLLTLHDPLPLPDTEADRNKNERTVKSLTSLDGSVIKEKMGSSIANFDQVSGSVFRGAAPGHDGMARLAATGFKTVVDLRMNGLGTLMEEREARELGLNYVHMPLTFNKPSLDKVAHFMNIIQDKKNQPVFVHCRHGADRTGTLFGIMRLTQDKWTFERTYQEMREHHFKPWFQNLKNMVASFSKQENVRLLSRAIKSDRAIQASLSAGADHDSNSRLQASRPQNLE